MEIESLPRTDKEKRYSNWQEIVVEKFRLLQPEFASKFVVENFFPQMRLKELITDVDVSKLYDEARTYGLQDAYSKELESIPLEAISKVLGEDLQERANLRFQYILACIGKLDFVDFILEAVDFYEVKLYDQIPQESIAILRQGLLSTRANIINLITELKEIQVSPRNDFKTICNCEKKLVLLTSEIMHYATAYEVVSRTDDKHIGIIQYWMKEHLVEVVSGRVGTYTRGMRGCMVEMLRAMYTQSMMLPEWNTFTYEFRVELSTSGMGAISSVINTIVGESAKKGLKSDIKLTDGVYFEITDVLIDRGIPFSLIQLNTPGIYANLVAEASDKTESPLIIITQPFGGGTEKGFINIYELLKEINNRDINRPLYIIVDATMHGSEIKPLNIVDEILKQGKDVTLILVQSLIKTAQFGMDKAPGGVIVAYGRHPSMPLISIGTHGGIMSEYNAASIIPYVDQAQQRRILRAAENSSQLAAKLDTLSAELPLFKVHYSGEEDPINVYKTKPGVLFLRLHPAITPLSRSLLVNIPGLEQGTSYGFLRTRMEEFQVGLKSEGLIRIACGQESPVLLENIYHSIRSHFINVRIHSGQVRTLAKYLRYPISTLATSVETLLPSTGEAENPYTKTIDFSLELNTNAIGNIGYMIDAALVIHHLRQDKRLMDFLGFQEYEFVDIRINEYDYIQAYKLFVITTPEYINMMQKRLKFIRWDFINPSAIYIHSRSLLRSSVIAKIFWPFTRLMDKVIDELAVQVYEKYTVRKPEFQQVAWSEKVN